ncbi:MAG: class I SAM-dependent methyltransferase [Gemmatimonadota bacterium]|nr:class I SAM-dependent methyltransferase [Gemmatimonadota bacterium]
MSTSANEVWKNDWVVRRFLEGVRGGVPYANDQLDVMLRLLDATRQPITRFLDLGSGSGLLAIAILTRRPDAKATLVDFSEPMMEAARDLLGEDASLPSFVLADLNSPDWALSVVDDGPYDAIVSGFAIHHLAHSRKATLYQEILPLLRPGALFVNVEHVASGSPWVEHVWDDAMIDSLTEYHERQRTGQQRSTIERDYRQRPDQHANELAPVEEQLTWLRDAGFADVDCFFKYFELAVIGGRRPTD